MGLCKNAHAGEQAWFCYDFGGRKTKGKEALDSNGRCKACAMAVDGSDNPPSFMQGNED